MYKTQSRNMLRRSMRSAQKAQLTRVRIKDSSSVIAFKKQKRRVELMATESHLVDGLGTGPEFSLSVFTRFKRHFAKLKFDIKRCSAYLNLVAGNRMLNGALWSDQAIESMFRRALVRKKRH